MSTIVRKMDCKKKNNQLSFQFIYHISKLFQDKKTDEVKTVL